MSQADSKGAVHWIDHYVMGTNDLSAWVAWVENVLGARPDPVRGLRTGDRKRNQPIFCFCPWEDPSCRIGAFLQPEQYPPGKELGKDLPRCGFFVRPEELDDHVRRLERHDVPHTQPFRSVENGDIGTTVQFEDCDGNQYEFLAPDVMPRGAMEVSTRLGVGRISHMVYGARELERTATFYKEICGLTPVESDARPNDVLVLGLVGGARIIYYKVDTVDERAAGHSPWWDMHAALTIPDDAFFPNHHNMWKTLPEEEMPKEELNQPREEEDDLPARTGLHRSPAGYEWKAHYHRGEEFYDWDGHAFHFVGGLSKTSDGSLSLYESKDPAEYLEELKASLAIEGTS